MRQLGKSTWVLEGPTNIGFITDGSDVILIDSGNDKESGRKINKILKERNWTLKAIINTHSNADHIGGNDYLQRNLNCDIFAPEIEKAFIEHPELETAFLWGGFEIRDLRNKFFHAKASKVTRTISETDEIENGIKIISLKGHFMNMIGLLSPDNIVFLADSLFGNEVLNKYGIPFIYDVRSFKSTINEIKNMDAGYFVPSHGVIEEDIRPLADYNLVLVENIEDELIKILKTGKCFEEILREVCDWFGIQLNPGGYALIGSSIRSFLSYLLDEEKIKFEFEQNMMIWRANTSDAWGSNSQIS